jgi:hypothetical protein
MLPVFLALSNPSQTVCLMSSIQPTTESPIQKVVNYLNRKGKLELWSGVMANQMIQDHRNEQRKNQAAESAFVRQQVWGEKPGQSIEDDMGTTILGDVTNPTPIVINSQPQQSGGALKTLAILAAGALIPGAGIGGYLASQWLNQKTVAKETEDESLDLGLLKFEDLKQHDQQQ